MTTTSYHKTAISRSKPSAPAQWLYDNRSVPADRSVLDYGCGRGKDVDHFYWEGYDPNSPDEELRLPIAGEFDTILCTYVLNVIENEWERKDVLTMIRTLLSKDGTAYITVRNDKKNLNGLTSRGSWQGHIQLDLPIVRKTSSYIIYELRKN